MWKRDLSCEASLISGSAKYVIKSAVGGLSLLITAQGGRNLIFLDKFYLLERSMNVLFRFISFLV